MEKIDINSRYLESEEAGRSVGPYEDFYLMMSRVLNFSNIRSVMDIGCSDGHLIDVIQRNHPHIEVSGIEYFEYHKKHASKDIVEKIHFLDIRDPLPESLADKKFDVVICTEIGEHIDPAFCKAFLENVRSLTGAALIMTWSSHGGEKELHVDPHHQHLNPLSLQDFINLMKSSGFSLNIEASQQLLGHSMQLGNFFSWWRESLTLWHVVQK